MNEHKFYNEYVKPVLEEIKEELKKRGVDTFIDGNELLIGGGGKGMSILTYNYAFAEFNVHEDYHNFFENEFNVVNNASKLIFKPIKPKSIYDLEIGDVVYYVSEEGRCQDYLIEDTYDLEFCQKLLENDNVFLTQEECEKRIAKNQAIAKIKERAYELQGDWKPNWKDHDSSKYLIRYNNYVGELVVNYHTYMQSDDMFFKTEEIAQQISGELFEECKLMLEVE